MNTKNTRLLGSSLLMGLFVLFATNAWTATYTTVEDGNWSDPNVWSTDGGVTSCFCTPGTTTNGNDFVINHDIILTDHLMVNSNSDFVVNTSGSLYGPTFNFTSQGNSNAQIDGPCTFNKLINGKFNGTSGGYITISNTTTEISAQIVLFAGITRLDGGFLYAVVGNFTVLDNAEFYTLSGSKLELFAGNISISGLVDICADCCLTTKGNWVNEATGTVQGSGSATTTIGNMKNYNSWSTDITWCSNGFDVGMPTPENCTNSISTCGVIVLPTELVSFTGYHRDSYNEVTWETASEKNCDYFLVKRSYEGFNWEVIDQVDAAGNSESMQFYSITDNNLSSSESIVYYRLEQYDFDGDRTLSNPISISGNVLTEDMLVYPNPTSRSNTVYINGISGNKELRIVSAKGIVLIDELLHDFEGTYEIPGNLLDKGLYFAQVTDNEDGEIKTVRFVIN